MSALLRQPRWIVLGVLVALITALFMSLGFWQLRRLDERQLDNAVIGERRSGEPRSLESVVGLDDSTVRAGALHRGRTITASGAYDPSEEILLRSRTHNGEAGFHVVTPLILADGSGVLVNRGWVPLSFDAVPSPIAPPAGVVSVTGVVEASAVRPRFGPTDPPGDVDVFSRSDVSRIQEQIGYPLYPVVVLSQEPAEAPIPIELPPLEDGPHLAYAIQWFAFAVIAVAGFGALLRTTARNAAARRGAVPAADAGDRTLTSSG